MKVRYFQDTDTLYIEFRPTRAGAPHFFFEEVTA
jgi:uncharacterized protein YuzE